MKKTTQKFKIKRDRIWNEIEHVHTMQLFIIFYNGCACCIAEKYEGKADKENVTIQTQLIASGGDAYLFIYFFK